MTCLIKTHVVMNRSLRIYCCKGTTFSLFSQRFFNDNYCLMASLIIFSDELTPVSQLSSHFMCGDTILTTIPT